MPTQSGTGVVREKTVGLRGGRVDHLPDVDSEAVAHESHFVDERDVDHAETVFNQLCHLRGTQGGDRDQTIHD